MHDDDTFLLALKMFARNKGGVARFLHARLASLSTIQSSPFLTGARPEDGVPDMTVISEIDEYGINTNLKVRYRQGRIYVSSLS